MKPLIKYIIILTGLLPCTTLPAQTEKPPTPGTPKNFVLPARETKTLANGLKTTMVEYGDIPKVNITLIVKTGKVHEAANQVWLADLTGEMLQQGTKKMNFKTLAKHTAAMGGDVTVSVGWDQVRISGVVLSEFAPAFIQVIRDVVMEPAFPATELERLKSDQKRRLAIEKTYPSSIAENVFLKTMFANHAYGRYFPTEEMIGTYTVGMVKDFFDKNFGAKRSVLYIVGKFDKAAVTAAVDKDFSSWKAGPAVMYPPVKVADKTDTIIVDRKGAAQTTIIMGQPVLLPKDKLMLAQRVANSLLGGSFSSRITKNIRETKGYTYSPYSEISNLYTSSLWIERADVTSEHTADALKEIRKEIETLQKEPPPAEELEGIQKLEAGFFVLRNSSLEGIINQLNLVELYGLDNSYLTDHVNKLYKVTPMEVTQIAKRYFSPDKMLVVMVGDKEKIEKQMRGN